VPETVSSQWTLHSKAVADVICVVVGYLESSQRRLETIVMLEDQKDTRANPCVIGRPADHYILLVVVSAPQAGDGVN
jgi:hypothetical protein